MARVALLVVTMGCAAPALAGWTETFEGGLGRFIETTGYGDTLYVWIDASDSIRATSVKDGGVDRRYASLGSSYDLHRSVFRFTATVTPLSATIHGAYLAEFHLGLFEGMGSNSENKVVAAFRYGAESGLQFALSMLHADGTSHQTDWVDLEMTLTYFMKYIVDGPGHLISCDLYEGTDSTGPLLTSLSLDFEPYRPVEIDALGLSNPLGVAPTIFTASIHAVSFTSCVGDLTGDACVGWDDLEELLSGYGLDDRGDLDGDGDTDLSDLAVLLSNYGEDCR